MKYFKLTFSGRIKSESSLKETLAALEKAFNIPCVQWQQVIDGDTQFILNDLDYFTASQLQERFSHSGAVATIDLTNQPLPEQYDEECCPACASSSQAQGICLDCGIVIHKFWSNLVNRYNKSEQVESVNKPLRETKKESVHLRKWLIRTSILLTGGFIADRYLQESSILFLLDVDTGLWPFVPGYLALIYSVLLLTRMLGYKSAINFIGLLYLPGLAFALLLPPKGEPMRPQKKNVIVSIICLAFSAYWLFGLTNDYQAKGSILDRSTSLSDGRMLYPDTRVHDNPFVFVSERDEVTEYLEETLSGLNQQSIRRGDYARILNSTFSAMTDYLAWWEHQRMLFSLAGLTLPEELSSQWRETTLENWMSLYYFYYTTESDPKHLSMIMDGFSGKGENMAGLNTLGITLSSEIIHIYDQVRSYKLQQYYQSSEPKYFSYEKAVIKGRSLQIQFEHPYIIVTDKAGPLFETPLVLAVYEREIVRYKKTSFVTELVRVNSDFPEKYIINNIVRLLDEPFVFKQPLQQ